MPPGRALLHIAFAWVLEVGSLLSPGSCGREPLGVRVRCGLDCRYGQRNGLQPRIQSRLLPGSELFVRPMMQITPTGGLFQFSLAGVGKYHVRLDNGINIVPFTGIGLLHNSLDRGTGLGRIDRSDTSWYIPIGVSLEYQFVHNVALSSTVIVNLHDIDLTPSLTEEDKTSVALMFGFRWWP